MMTATMTTPVEVMSSLRGGQVTLLISMRTSRRKVRTRPWGLAVTVPRGPVVCLELAVDERANGFLMPPDGCFAGALPLAAGALLLTVLSLTLLAMTSTRRSGRS